MSLNKSLNRLFDEIRREVKRNPDFANRLDAIFQAHDSNRDVPDDLVEAERAAPEAEAIVAEAPAKPAADTPDLNPVAFFTREGAEGLKSALGKFSKPALESLVSEHNLDPAGATAGFAKPALVDHIIVQAQKRVERDRKMFDY